jgi:hypothetical protein
MEAMTLPLYWVETGAMMAEVDEQMRANQEAREKQKAKKR